MAIEPTQGRRLSRRLILAPVILPLFLLTLLLTGLILGSRTPVSRIQSPPQRLLPGNPLPDGAECLWPPYGSDVILCRVTADRSLIYLTYDVHRQMITRTSLAIADQPIGSLILDWGTPTGIRIYSWSVQVCWGLKSVYISANPFRPINRTSFVSFGLEPEETIPWHGFSG
jgi:hypothetical protein